MHASEHLYQTPNSACDGSTLLTLIQFDASFAARMQCHAPEYNTSSP